MPNTQMNAMSHFPECSGKLPGHYPETPRGLPSSISPLLVTKVLAMLLPLTISQSSFPKAFGWQHKAHYLVFCKAYSWLNLAKTLNLCLFLPIVFEHALGGWIATGLKCHLSAGFPASQPYSHHKSLPPKTLFELLNWFQNEFTLNTRWTHLNESFTKLFC